MRTLKELLIILRDNTEVHKSFLGLKQQIDSGLCQELRNLRRKDIITLDERLVIHSYIMKHVKFNNYKYSGYLFLPTLWRCRKKWLNKQIKLLK